MRNTKSQIFLTVVCIFILQPMLSPSSLAFARKKTPPKAYSFIAEGGKASQGECDGERKLPRMKRHKEFAKTGSYMGSELIESELKGKTNEEMWKHFFRDKGTCNSVLAKTPSSVQDPALANTKREIPPDDSDDADDEARPGAGGPDAE